ncbi:transcription initiation factor tfiid subunit 7 [Apiospora arundinis]|uniref:TAFII55 protein conserved region-domain-containing protein n=1 Tax=Apiospora arundinis TaxID=335852 RepID=A0ABR2J9E3_9PEZI
MGDDNGGKKPTLKLNTMPPPSTTAIKAAATPATENPRPILKLNTASRQPSFSGDTPTPGGSEKKIKIKIQSTPTTPGVTTPALHKTKAGRQPKPTAKVIESKKRTYSSDEDQPLASKKIKVKKTGSGPTPLLSATTPLGIKWRAKGEPVKHRPGDAYDSEADDKEGDPVRETLMILRTLPGPSTAYLREALEKGTIGQPKANGGADVSIQFIDAKERRAMVTVDGEHYAAVLVDLPTITEAMKSWDRKAMMKNSDVTQMLLCFAKVKNEIDAKTIAVPPMAQRSELRWPHGLTPPMHDAVNRRFRKVMTEKQLASVSQMVKKLMADDEKAIETSIEYIQDNEDEDMSDSGADAEGDEDEEDYFGPQTGAEEDEEEPDIDDEDLEREFELAGMEMDMEAEAATPATQMEAATPMTMGAATPGGPLQDQSENEIEEDEEEISEEDDDDDDDDDEVDEEEQQKREAREDLHQLERQLATAEAQFQAQQNPILKRRIMNTIQKTKEEIALKKAKLGVTDDD